MRVRGDHAPRLGAQRLAQALVALLRRDRDCDDAGDPGCKRQRGTGRRLECGRLHPAEREPPESGPAPARRTLGKLDSRRRRKRERDLVGGSKPVAGIDLETAQDDFLQPLGRRRHDAAGGDRIAIETPAQLPDSARRAEWSASRRELVEHPAERVDVGTRITAHAQHLLGGHVDPVAERNPELLGEKIGVVAMAGKAEVDEHHFAARTKHHVGRLQVQVDDVLPVQLMQRHGDRGPQACDFFGCHRGAVKRVVQADAVDELHDEIGRGFEVAIGDERRVMQALGQCAQHGPADFEADDVHGALSGTEPRDLHDERERTVGTRQAEDDRHASGVNPLAEAESVDHAAWLKRAHHVPRSRRNATRSGSPAARILRIVAPTS